MRQRWLVAVAAAVLTILPGAPAHAQAAPAGKAKKPPPRKILRLEEMRIEGRVQKPQAMFLLPRSTLSTGELDRGEPVLPKVVEALQKPPF
jgi:hypothetical protein